MGREPEVVLCRWNEETDWPESVFDREPGYKPTVQRPLVYHLLGLLELPSSLVLTEDDYFDFLTGVTRDREVVPKSVRAALSGLGADVRRVPHRRVGLPCPVQRSR